jgi:ABC-type uncharacterized transport system auxiliary subunit
VKRLALPMVLCASLASACALTSRSEPMQVRYFDADTARRSVASNPAASTQQAQNLSLRLGRVRASAHLEEDIAYRTGVHELGYYEGERWTDKPEAFLERALARALFQERGVQRVVGGASEALSVELVSFEEVRGQRPVARVEILVTLHDERASQLEQTILVERPIPNTGKDRPSRAVAALSEALDEAVERIAVLVTERLTALAATNTQAAPPGGGGSAEAAAR